MLLSLGAYPDVQMDGDITPSSLQDNPDILTLLETANVEKTSEMMLNRCCKVGHPTILLSEDQLITVFLHIASNPQITRQINFGLTSFTDANLQALNDAMQHNTYVKELFFLKEPALATKDRSLLVTTINNKTEANRWLDKGRSMTLKALCIYNLHRGSSRDYFFYFRGFLDRPPTLFETLEYRVVKTIENRITAAPTLFNTLARGVASLVSQTTEADQTIFQQACPVQ